MFKMKTRPIGRRIVAILALASAVLIGAGSAQAAPIVVSQPQVEIDTCSYEKCSIIQELEYSADAKSAFGVMINRENKDEKYSKYYSLFKFDFATKKKTVLVSLPREFSGYAGLKPGQITSTSWLDNVRPSNDGKYVFYIERKDSQTVNSIGPDGTITFKNYVKTHTLKLRTLASGKTEVLNTQFGLKQARPFHVTWAANSKSLSMLSQSIESGLHLSTLTLATKKVTKGPPNNAPGFLSRNGKYASIGIWWLGEQKFQVVATRKTTNIEGAVYGPVVLLNDGVHMIAEFQGSGLTIFTTSGKKKLLMPGSSLRWYSLSPDEKTLMFVYSATSDGDALTNGYSLLKVELPD